MFIKCKSLMGILGSMMHPDPLNMFTTMNELQLASFIRKKKFAHFLKMMQIGDINILALNGIFLSCVKKNA